MDPEAVRATGTDGDGVLVSCLAYEGRTRGTSGDNMRRKGAEPSKREKKGKSAGLADKASIRSRKNWWAQQDSNLRPTDYESAALPTELWAPLNRASKSHATRPVPQYVSRTARSFQAEVPALRK